MGRIASVWSTGYGERRFGPERVGALLRDNLLKLWKLYGRYIIAAAALALVVAGTIVAWRDHQLAERRAQSARYASAMNLARDGKDADAVKVFGVVAHE